MTRRTNARIAGFAFLFYIAVGFGSLAVARTVPAAALLPVLTSFSAVVLGVTLYAITRDQDRDLAMLALVCRIIEGVPGEGTIYFAVGSLLFSWLLLRGRMVPVALAWLGVVSSAMVVMLIPVQIVGYLGGPGSWQSPVTWFVWLPLLIFEVALAFWLIIKGATEPAPRQDDVGRRASLARVNDA